MFKVAVTFLGLFLVFELLQAPKVWEYPGMGRWNRPRWEGEGKEDWVVSPL